MNKAEKVIELAESMSISENANEVAKKFLGALHNHPQNTILHGDIVRKASSMKPEHVHKVMLGLERHGFVSRPGDDRTPPTHPPRVWVINKDKIKSLKRG